MRSFTDTFIKHPVLAVVVNLVIVLVGWRAITTLPVQQYPNIQSSSVLITTVYYGASAETVRGLLTTLAGVQRVDVVGGRPIAMRIWIDPDRLAALNLAPGDVHASLQRNNYLAAVGQTKGDLVQVNLLANTDLRTSEEFKNLVVAERNGAIVRLSEVARVELGAEV